MLIKPFSIILLALTPILAITTSFLHSMFLGFAVLFVLIFSSFVVVFFGKQMPSNWRMFISLAIISVGVTIAEMFLAAFAFGIANDLNIFVPLMVTSLLIYVAIDKAYDHGFSSIKDCFNYGVAFIISIAGIALFREFFGSGYFLGQQILSDVFVSNFLLQPFGAFLSVAVVLAFTQAFGNTKLSTNMDISDDVGISDMEVK